MRVVVLIALVSLLSSSAYAQQAPKPTKQHEYLKKDLGNWTGTMKMYAQPGADPTELAVEETNTMFGELWMITEFKAGPFLGRGQFGYDEKKKKFVGTWVDNMNPYMSMMEGDFDTEKQEMVMEFNGIDPATGDDVKMKSVTISKQKDVRKFAMYSKKEGQWKKEFEIDYRRTP